MNTPLSDETPDLANYDPRVYAPVAVTVDVVALTVREGDLQVLLVQRAAAPFAGAWALPGGFLRPHQDTEGHLVFENLHAAAARTLAAETGLEAALDPDPAVVRDALGRIHLEQLGTYGDPGRDPRMHVVSVAYLAFAPRLPEPTAGAGTMAARWVSVSALGLPDATLEGRPLAFDHARILADGLERARSKIEYTPLAVAFVGEQFTLAELAEVYATIWGEQLHIPNFRRKVLSTPQFVEPIGVTTRRRGQRGGPPAQLYREGHCLQLQPALLRRTTVTRLSGGS